MQAQVQDAQALGEVQSMKTHTDGWGHSHSRETTIEALGA